MNDNNNLLSYISILYTRLLYLFYPSVEIIHVSFFYRNLNSIEKYKI